MNDLNEINKAAKSTHFIFLISLILPIFMGAACWALAAGVSQSNAPQGNYLATSAGAISIIALVAAPLSYLFKWDWRTGYYGASLFGIASVSCLGLYPLLCIVIYGSLPVLIRIALLSLEIGVVFAWCLRFVHTYRKISQDSNLFEKIYKEESDAVYFLQQGDKQVLEKNLHFRQFPSGKYFLFSFLSALALCIFYAPATKLFGVPFTQIFLAFSMAPVPAAFLGVATKMWLVFFEYPKQIKRRTEKLTYVDMVSQPSKR